MSGQAKTVMPVAGPVTRTARRGQSLFFSRAPGCGEQRTLVFGTVTVTLLSDPPSERTICKFLFIFCSLRDVVSSK